MLKRFYNWILSFFRKSAGDHEEYVEVERTKAPDVVENQCACGCGTQMTNAASTLRFFASKACRRSYRKRYGAFDYGKYR